jgi:hypothetical protein
MRARGTALAMRPAMRVVSLMVLAACSGEIGDVRSAPPDGEPPGELPPGYVPGDIVPVEPALHRLTNAEYDRTVADLFALDYAASERFGFQADDLVDGYPNSLAVLNVTLARAKAYRGAAQRIARDALGEPDRRNALMGCDVTSDGECLRAFLETFGRRVYRRPLEGSEIERLLALGDVVDSGGPTERAILALEAMLQSPHFLHRVEIGEGEDAERALTGYELATRLSYTLFGTTPDDGLLDRAARGELADRSSIDALVREMLADDRAAIGLTGFIDAWLRLTEAARSGEPLLTDATEETRRVVREHIFGDVFFGDVFVTRSSWLTPALATAYEVSAGGEGFFAHRFDDDAPRSGILTHASFLSSTANGGRIVAVPRRGKIVRESFLCLEALALPGDLDLPEADPNATVREFWAPIEANGACGGCHGVMNPIGHLFDRYDASGAYRELDDRGRPIPEDGAFVRTPGAEPLPLTGVSAIAATSTRRRRSSITRVASSISWRRSSRATPSSG